MTGKEIVESFAEGTLDVDHVGRQGGRHGKAFQNDVADGGWRTFRYEVRSGALSGNRELVPDHSVPVRHLRETPSTGSRAGSGDRAGGVLTDPVIADISSAIRVSHIRTPSSEIRQVSEGDQQGQVLAFMTDQQYDTTPVLGEGGVTGLLWREDLLDAATPVSEASRGLTAEMLVEARAPLVDLVARFRDGQRFLLVLDGRGVDGVVTPSNLDKQAGRTHLFMEISALELGLAEEARSIQQSDPDALRAALPPAVYARSTIG